MATWAPTKYAGGNTETTYFNAWNGPFNWSVPPSGMTSTSQLFGSQSYTRGAMTYEALRAAIGDPAFFELIKQWQTTYTGQTRIWTDLFAMAAQISGRDLDAFFDDWINDADKPAWPGKLSLVLGAAPGAGPVPAGSAMSYSLSATNTGKVDLTGAVVDVDLTHVLDHATLGTLPAGLSLVGTTLTWTVPTTSVGDVATTSFPVTVQPAAEGATLSASASISTLGGTCATCSVTHTVGPQVAPPPPPAPSTFGAQCQVRVTGKPLVGRKLSVRTKGCPVGTVVSSYQWFAGGKPIKGADKATYKIKRSKLGKRITVRGDGERTRVRRRGAGEPADQEGALGGKTQQCARLAGGHRRALGDPAGLDGAVDELRVGLDRYALADGQHVLHADPQVTALGQRRRASRPGCERPMPVADHDVTASGRAATPATRAAAVPGMPPGTPITKSTCTLPPYGRP